MSDSLLSLNSSKSNTWRSQGRNKNITSQKQRAKNIGHYILGNALGEGTFGKVWKAIHLHTGEKVCFDSK